MTLTLQQEVNLSDLTIPVGSVVMVNGLPYLRNADGWWSSSARWFGVPYEANVRGVLVHLPNRTETLAQFKQRFAVSVMHKAMEQGGGGYRDGVQSMLSRLGLTDPRGERLRVGSWVSTSVDETVIPRGAIAMRGAPERHENNYLAQWQGQWRQVDGFNVRLAYLMQIVALPEDYAAEEWPEPAEDEDLLITAFMRQAWDVGWREKLARSWCAEFERGMSSANLGQAFIDSLPTTTLPGIEVGGRAVSHAHLDLAPVGTRIDEGGTWSATKQQDGRWLTNAGLSRSVGEIVVNQRLRYAHVPLATGTTVSAEQVAQMPPGAVILWAGAHGGGERTIFGRPGDGVQTYGTSQTCSIAFTEFGHHSHRGMTVLWDGSTPIHTVPVHDAETAALMPVGTEFGEYFDDEGRPRYAWRKAENGRWFRVQTDGSMGGTGSTERDFSYGALRFNHIPVPGVEHTPALPRD